MEDYYSKIQEELSDLACREMLGQLSEADGERLRQLRRECGVSSIDSQHIVRRLRRNNEFDHTTAYIKFRNTQTTHKQKRYRRIVRICCSAAAVVVMLIGLRMILKQQTDEQRNTIITHAIIAPGKSKAFITMGNGERIELGSTKQELQEADGTRLSFDSTLIAYQGLSGSKQPVYNTIDIPIGGEYQLLLADGSKVWMNADSKLRFPVSFCGAQREVFLEGEAYFEVKEDKQHPFIVHTSRGAVEVLGTHFNIRDYSDEAKVVTTLVNGRVAYRSSKQKSERIVLQPGYQVEDREGSPLVPHSVNVEMYVGWKDGKYIFENRTLEEIMQILSKWYDIVVFYRGERVKNLHFTGDLERYKNINDFLEFLEVGGDVRFTIKGKTLIIE